MQKQINIDTATIEELKSFYYDMNKELLSLQNQLSVLERVISSKQNPNPVNFKKLDEKAKEK